LNDYIGGILWKDIVLVYPNKLKNIAKDNFLLVKDYKYSVILNELAQVYFWKIIPSKFFWIFLNDFWITTWWKDWKIYHVNEAFSDYIIIKEWKNLKYEIFRIINSKIDSYDLSYCIIIAAKI